MQSAGQAIGALSLSAQPETARTRRGRACQLIECQSACQHIGLTRSYLWGWFWFFELYIIVRSKKAAASSSIDTRRQHRKSAQACKPCQQRSIGYRSPSRGVSWLAPKPEDTATLCLLQTASCTCPKCRLEGLYITWHCLEGQIRFQEGPRAF